MPRRAAPHRGLDVHYGDASGASPGDASGGTDGPGRPSKTQLKQQSQQLQDLGVALAALPEDRLAAAPMPDALRAAIEAYRRTRSHEGRRRQMQYVGKLMRHADEEALREVVAEATIGSARQALALHEAERWRAELIADDAALQRWIAAHPATDAQHLRSLVRAARRDAQPQQPADGLAPRQPRSFRELFQYIRPRLAAAGSGDDAGPVADPGDDA
jgi:ribosome-associated protein